MKDPYVYEDTGTLINKLGIKDYKELRKAESDISFVKLLSVDANVDCHKFDLEYIQNIHKYVLGDIYDWAGEFRTVPMEKPEEVLGGDTVRYSYPKEIIPKAQKYINEINSINWNNIELEDKALKFSKLIAGLWQVHPFRDGNTRTIITYAFRFAEEHGFKMDRNLILENFGYVRNALVKASDGKYSEYKYLTHIVRDSIKNGQESVENNNNAKVAKSKEESEEER